MMKKFKQFIAFVLTLCMLFSLSVAALLRCSAVPALHMLKLTNKYPRFIDQE